MLGAIFETIPDFNHCDLFKKRFVIFLKGATLSDFFYTRLSNYVSSGIQIHFPLFRRIFFQLGMVQTSSSCVISPKCEWSH